MCVLSIKVLLRKKSGNLFNDPRIYINIYIRGSLNKFPDFFLPVDDYIYM